MLTDPVTGFRYPDTWVKACVTPELIGDIAKGLCVLTASGTVLRRGYTTGSTAAAASKAAVLSLAGPVTSVLIGIPCGLDILISAEGRGGRATAIKFSGDYQSDVTSGLEFVAAARPAEDGVSLIAGKGIGRFTRDMPRYPAGSPAISTAAREYILTAIREAMGATGLQGVEVEISIPRGEEIAGKTLNSRLGITGGISILGTTGLVEPWDDHVSESITDRLKDLDRVVITTGRIGLRHSRLMFPDHEAVLVGTRMKEALTVAKGSVILCGMPGLILKFIDPDIVSKTGYGSVQEMMLAPDWMSIVKGRLEEFKRLRPDVRVVLIDHDGKVVGDSG